MAIDTANKRAMMMSMCTPYVWPRLWVPDGSVDSDDRFLLLHIYEVTAAGTIIEIPLGTLTISGFAPSPDKTLAMAVGAIDIAGEIPSPNESIPIPVGTITLAGLAPTVVAAFDLPIPAGSIVISGLSWTQNIDQPIGAGFIEINGLGVVVGEGVNIPVGTIVIAGQAPTQQLDQPIAVGQILINGQAPLIIGAEFFELIAQPVSAFASMAAATITTLDDTPTKEGTPGPLNQEGHADNTVPEWLP